MSRATPSVIEDRQAIEKTINGMIRLARGYTRRQYPLRHCLKIAQCEELIELCDELKGIAGDQLVIKRDKQGTKSKLNKLHSKRNTMQDDLNQVSIEISLLEEVPRLGRGHEHVGDEDCMICEENQV